MKRLIAPLVLALSFTPSVAQASEWHRTGDATTYADLTAAAPRHLARHVDDLGLQTVQLTARHPKQTATSHATRFHTARFDQTYAGLPVIGGQAAVRVGADGRVSRTVLSVARDLTVSTLPSLPAAAANTLAVSRTNSPNATPRRTQLAVLPDGDGGMLIWEVDVPTLDGGWRVWVNAHSGELVHERPLAHHALGTVYPISSVTTPDTEDRELTSLVPLSPQHLTGWDGNLTVTNYVSGSSQNGDYLLEQILVPSAGEDFLYAPPTDTTDPNDAFAQVGIYYHLTRMRDFATNTLGVNMASSSWKLVAVANVKEGGAPMDNAFFSPQGLGAPWNAPNMIAIGQGSMFDFAQDSDVFNHEFTHYLTHNAIGYNGGPFHIDSWGISHFSGAIDEGISDYFATTVNGDSFLGEASLALLGSGRDLTSTWKVCPENLTGEVHSDGEIIGSVAWSLRESLGAEIADQLVWGAVSLLTFGAPFGDFADGLVQTAADMVTAGTMMPAQAATVEDVLAERGLDECGHELPMDGSADVNLEGLGGFCSQAKQMGFEKKSMFHYVITPGEDALGLVIDVELLGLQPGDEPRWNLYANASSHVSFQPSFPPVVFDYDHALEGVTTENGKLVIDEQTMPAFESGTTYHIVITHQHCGNAIAQVTAKDILTPPNTGTGGMGAGGQGGAVDNGLDEPPTVVDGCGCRTNGSPAHGLGWTLALLGIAGLRRRRSSPTAGR